MRLKTCPSGNKQQLQLLNKPNKSSCKVFPFYRTKYVNISVRTRYLSVRFAIFNLQMAIVIKSVDISN